MEEVYAISVQREDKKSSLLEEVKEIKTEIAKEQVRAEFKENG